MIPRSDKVWLRSFASAGLTLVKAEVQRGFSEELYEVKTSVSYNV